MEEQQKGNPLNLIFFIICLTKYYKDKSSISTQTVYLIQVCGKVKSTLEYATVICTQYGERVRRLSGMGMQLSPVVGVCIG